MDYHRFKKTGFFFLKPRFFFNTQKKEGNRFHRYISTLFISVFHLLLYPPIQHNDKLFNEIGQGTRLMKAVLPFTLVQGAFTTSAPPSRQRWEKHRFFLSNKKEISRRFVGSIKNAKNG